MTRNYEEYTRAFEACDIDAADFAHVDHLGVAYEMLRKYDFLKAAHIYGERLNRIATAAGAAEKFNATITLVFLSVIAERMEATNAASFPEFLAENSDLLTGDLLEKWYSSDRLTSPMARKLFLMPDVAA